MKKSRFLPAGLAVALLALARSASAQVTITFTSASVAAVPLSPWLMVALAFPILLIGGNVLHKHKGGGILMMALGCAGLLGATLYPLPGYSYTALITPTPMTSSPAEITNLAYVADFSEFNACGPIGYAWVSNGNSADITISDIAFDTAAGYAAFDAATNPYTTDPTSFSGPTGVSTCAVGTVLGSQASCVVWYQKLSDMC